MGKLDYHLTVYPFSIRYLTSYPLLLLSRVFHFPVRESFFVLQFSLSFLLGLAFFRYLRQLDFSRLWANVGVFILMSAYPMLCAHFEPVHTWDDIWAYLFVTLSLTAVLRRQVTATLIWFTLACFAREQTLVLYPVFAIPFWWLLAKNKPPAKILWLLVPVVVYGLFYAIVWQEPIASRYRLIDFNFETALRSRDTIFSLYISFGVIWLLAGVSLVRQLAGKLEVSDKILTWGLILSVPATVVVALFLSCARETRILFPPFVFALPLALYEIQGLTRIVDRIRKRGHLTSLILGGGVLAAFGLYLSFLIFPAFEFRNCARFAQQWSGVHFGAILITLALYVASYINRKRISRSDANAK